ncbi:MULTISPECIES: HEPN domain-containing protein [Thermodesulfovibrio]|jgi:HEPN domain-containing protein|uniref:HEPN domain-containing protein n=1 Tax=Thermodesulfovibrio TaxID=28261 RepID=UPI001143F652|nr:MULTISPECIES: HEPN domain-containing protein [Thermodesulfovibrio]MDI6864462.1 HEPN domain-containing protein [Thermodesulfovibrio yellowstonii]
MKKISEFENFFKIACDDLKLVEKNLSDQEISRQLLFFHLQQATEKFLKALLAKKNVNFPKIHDIEKLIELCEENNIKVPDFIDDLIDLTPFAVEFRYGLIMEESIDIENYFEKVEKFKTVVENSIYGDL